MKQAFLICAHTNPDYVERLVNSLDSERSNIYVHIDKNRRNQFLEFEDRFKDRSNIQIYSEIACKYCGIGIVKSIALLLHVALKNSENEYFHFISGQDILTKPLDVVLDFFEENKTKNYIRFFDLPHPKWNLQGGLQRINVYYLNDIITCDDSHIYNKVLNRLCVEIQYLIGINRNSFKGWNLKGGSAWWSLNRDAIRILDDYFSCPDNWKGIRHTLIPDEFIFHTILCNSEIKDSLVCDNLRYIDWSRAKGTHPKTLDESDFDSILKSNSFFARKISTPNSDKLVDLLQEYTKSH